MSDRDRGVEGQPLVDRLFPDDLAIDSELEAELAVAADEPVPFYDTPVQRARRIGGIPGVMIAGGMIAIRDLLEEPKDDRPVVVAEAPSEPHDVDRDGVQLTVHGVDVAAPALPRADAVVTGRKRRRRRRPR